MAQFMKLFPHMVPGAVASQTPFYAFGQSYGGAYVVSLAHVYLDHRENDPDFIRDINLRGIGLGDAFVSPVDQSTYADYITNIGFMTDSEYEKMKANDDQMLAALEAEDYLLALKMTQDNLNIIANQAMALTNLYDFTFDQNYLTNHEYVCFLQQAYVRKGIHVGARKFADGVETYKAMQGTVMTDKKPWLEEALGRGIRVLVFNGNLDIIVNVAGTNRMINSLQWSGKKEFANSKRDGIWVWNEDTGRGEMSGYANDGGGLTYAVIRNAGHMVPISQPLWAHHLVTEFTHHIPGTPKFQKPLQMGTPNYSQSFVNCNM